MADDLCDETTIPRAREIARTALEAVNFSTEDGIVDLIADLMHLADEVNSGRAPDLRSGYRHGYDVMAAARSHYVAELPDFPPVLTLPTPEQMRDQTLTKAQAAYKLAGDLAYADPDEHEAKPCDHASPCNCCKICGRDISWLGGYSGNEWEHEE